MYVPKFLLVALHIDTLSTLSAYKQYPLTQEPLSQLDVTMPNPLFVDDDPTKPPGVAEDEVGKGLDSQELRVHISETDMQKELV